MFIDFKNKFIYVRTQKTGSSSVTACLKKGREFMDFKQIHAGNEFICFDNRDSKYKMKKEYILNRSKFVNPHLKPSEIKEIFENKRDFDDFIKITTIRNPYNHALSFFRYQRYLLFDQLKKYDISIFQYFLRNPFRVIAQYFFSFQNKITFKLFLIFFYKPYTNHFLYKGKNIIDVFIRMEHLQEDLQKFFDQYEIDINVEIEAINSNGNVNSSDNAKYLYDSWSKQYISNIYREILEKHNYDF